jgi:hypothetical protein
MKNKYLYLLLLIMIVLLSFLFMNNKNTNQIQNQNISIVILLCQVLLTEVEGSETRPLPNISIEHMDELKKRMENTKWPIRKQPDRPCISR